MAEDPTLVVKRYVEAADRDAVDDQVELFGEDVVAIIPGMAPIHGRAAVRGLIEYMAALNAELTLSETRLEGRTVIATGRYRDDLLTALGVEALDLAAMRFTIEDGRIVRMERQLSEGSSRELGAVLEQFIPWLAPQMPGEAADEGDVPINAEIAVGMLHAARRWAGHRD